MTILWCFYDFTMIKTILWLRVYHVNRDFDYLNPAKVIIEVNTNQIKTWSIPIWIALLKCITDLNKLVMGCSWTNRSFEWTREERVVSGSDSFSRACAPSYRFCTGISSPVSSLRVWVIRSSCDCPIHVTYSVWGKKDLVIIIINNKQLFSLFLLPHSVL